jgi:hypothetical protein
VKVKKLQGPHLETLQVPRARAGQGRRARHPGQGGDKTATGGREKRAVPSGGGEACQLDLGGTHLLEEDQVRAVLPEEDGEAGQIQPLRCVECEDGE